MPLKFQEEQSKTRKRGLNDTSQFRTIADYNKDQSDCNRDVSSSIGKDRITSSSEAELSNYCSKSCVIYDETCCDKCIKRPFILFILPISVLIISMVLFPDTTIV
ncbi:14462_t:CDS:2 [Funneliformis mosseae]|uniref:14462_t:CDS:1 n=1 Tax=Funneliformis mosseae TaxID=27381 RepID=A0A9N9GHN5_FUNMO|nr:14462_t:CDS:2 [Funneliformis mosseae]